MIMVARKGLIVPKRGVLRSSARRLLFPSPYVFIPRAVFHLGFKRSAPVVPGTITFNTGTSATYILPNFNTMIIEVWGGGGGGGGAVSTATGATNGAAGGLTAVRITSSGSVIVQANGGSPGGFVDSDTAPPASGGAGGAGVVFNSEDGTGDSGTQGNFGSAWLNYWNGTANVAGDDYVGGGAGGGGGTSSSALEQPSANNTSGVGKDGRAPGGGASGGVRRAGSANINYVGASGGGAGYAESVYPDHTILQNGMSLTYTVGAGGAGGTSATQLATGGLGAPGRVKFTWT